jgi:hypothetical protein
MKVALLIGPTYAERSGVTPLRYARNDAIALGDALRQVCRFDRVIVLAGDGTDGVPTRSAITEELERIAEGDDRISHFVFAFSGHGRRRTMNGQDHYFLFPADARAGNPGTLLDLPTVRLSLDRVPAAAITMILDCCRNDPDAGKGEADNLLPEEGLAKDLGIEPLPAAGGRAPGQGKALFLLNACSPGERAYENPGKERGAFFHHFIEGIEQKGRAGAWTVHEAFNHAKVALAASSRFNQTPTFLPVDPSRTAYLVETGGGAPPVPDPTPKWLDNRRSWFAAGAATLAVAACAGWLYVERWPWLDSQICSWRPDHCSPAETLVVNLSERLHAAEAKVADAEAKAALQDRVLGTAQAELTAARSAATQAAQRATRAEALVVEATRARDSAQAEARQAAAKAQAAEASDSVARGARDALSRAANEAQARAEAAERARDAAQLAAREAATGADAARRAASDAAAGQQAAAARAAAANGEIEGLKRERDAARAEATRLGQALAGAEAAGREKDARIAALSRPPAPPVPSPAPAPQPQPQPQGSGYPVAVGQSFRDCADCPEMTVIPAGSFMMGSPAN